MSLENLASITKSVVRIKDEDGVLVGGGVFVGQDLVLTAAHVVASGHVRYSVVCVHDRSSECCILHKDETRDLALLKVNHECTSDDIFLNVCNDAESISRGSQVHFIGHPSKMEYSYLTGNVSDIRDCVRLFRDLSPMNPKRCKDKLIDDFTDIGPNVMLVQVNNMHGVGRIGGTGAPILDSEGMITGIYSFTFREQDYAIHMDEIRSFLGNARTEEPKRSKKLKKGNNSKK